MKPMVTSLRSLLLKAAPGLATAALLSTAMPANEARAQMQAPVVSDDQGQSQAPARPGSRQYPRGSFYNPIQPPAPTRPFIGTPVTKPQAPMDVWFNGQQYVLIPLDQGVQAGSGNLVWFNGQWYVLIPVATAPYPGSPAPYNYGAPPAPYTYPTAPAPVAPPPAPLQVPVGTAAPAPAAVRGL